MAVMEKFGNVTPEHLDYYFDYVRERYEILLKRRLGFSPPWTKDTVLSSYRFTNVFREDDRTTEWFRENIRDPLKSSPSVVLATLAFRAFNRIEVGELLKPYLLDDNWDLKAWARLLSKHQSQDNPLVTGAYIVKTRSAMPKLQSMMMSLKLAKLDEPKILQFLRETAGRARHAEDLWKILCGFDYVGEFTANEIVVDQYHTDVLKDAVDLNTWTNPGPGCAQGLGLLLHDDKEYYNRHSSHDRAIMMEVLRYFLMKSKDARYWPQEWPKWNLHTVQFNFCELQKLIKGRAGKRLKRRYRYS